ncbi:signal peptidase II [Eubacteriales bacterium KG127]
MDTINYKKKFNLNLFLPVFLGIGIFLVDYLTKVYVRSFKEFTDGVVIIPSILNLIYIKNYGAAFSFLNGHTNFLIGITLMVMIVGLMYAIKYYKDNTVIMTGVCMIVAGGFGNLIDRILYGYVTDMISFSFFPPVFNVADVGVTVGAVIIAIYLIFFEKDKMGD